MHDAENTPWSSSGDDLRKIALYKEN